MTYKLNLNKTAKADKTLVDQRKNMLEMVDKPIEPKYPWPGKEGFAEKFGNSRYNFPSYNHHLDRLLKSYENNLRVIQ